MTTFFALFIGGSFCVDKILNTITCLFIIGGSFCFDMVLHTMTYVAKVSDLDLRNGTLLIHVMNMCIVYGLKLQGRFNSSID